MFKQLLFILSAFLKLFERKQRADEQDKHEDKVNDIKSDPGGHFANKFGRVQPDTVGSTDNMPDAATTDKTNA
jgi:hypothetical protein|tara:strand:- start:100 stop:318 length:219 start_codon:yes stop_codon:yes gene_type:complete